MKTQFTWSLLLALLVAAAGCDSGHGPDSLFAPKAGAVSSGCVACHNSTSTIAPDPLATNGSGTYGKHIGHVQSAGIPCEWCHYNYAQTSTHMTGTVDTGDPTVLIVQFDAVNSSGSWTSDTGPGTGICASVNCHAGYSLAWYGTSYPICAACHFMQMGSRRPVIGVNGDFAGNSAIVSHHVTSTADPTPALCQVCHEMTQHMAGTVRLKEADTEAIIVYSAASPTTLELFCLSCHDADGALISTISGSALDPFNDGNTLGTAPNAAGNKIADYWNAAYAVHRDNGLTCAGTGAPGTGCHGNSQMINMHGSVSKGLLTRNLTLPIQAWSAYDYNSFKLCFDCHESYDSVTKEVVLGYRQGGNYDVPWAPSPYSTTTTSIRSLFRDQYIGNSANYPLYWGGINQPYNDRIIYDDAFTPLHNYHLSPTTNEMQNIWNYRGTGSNIGRASCITCHNVHGTNGTVRSVYSEFGLAGFTGAGGDRYGKLEPIGNYEDIVFKNYPISCALSCHSMKPGTSYWHTPSNE